MAARLVVVDRPEYDLEALKARVDLRAVVTPGLPIRGDKPTKVLCFWHEETVPSLCVYPSRLHCFGCGAHMDLVDFVAWQEGLDVQQDMGAVLEALDARYVGLVPAPPPPKPKKPVQPVPWNVAEYFHQRLGRHREWFRRRGLTDATIDRERLGYERSAFTIPVWAPNGQLLTVRFRRDDDALGDEAEMHSKYWGMPGRNEVYLYNARSLPEVENWRGFRVGGEFMGGFVVICEGELDALRLSQEGIPAVSATNGVGAFHVGLVREVRGCDPDRVIAAYDQDPQGRGNAIRVARMFGVKGRVARWPRELGKDVTEFLLRSPLEELVLWLTRAEEPSRLEKDWIATLRNGVWR